MAERKDSDDNAWSIAEAESRILGELRGWIRTNQERITRETNRLRLLLISSAAVTVMLAAGVSYLLSARARAQIEQARSEVLEAANATKAQVSAAHDVQHDLDARVQEFQRRVD